MAQKNIWTHKSKEKIKKVSVELDRAILKKDVRKIKDILSDSENLRGLVLGRGEGNSKHNSLLDGVNFLIKVAYGGKVDLYNIDDERLIDYIKNNELPEQILAEISDIAYHRRDKKLFDKITKAVLENEDEWENDQLAPRVLHNQGSWAGSVDFNPERAIELNKAALESARKKGDKILELKAKFGLKINKLKKELGEKGIRPIERAHDFEELSLLLIENGNLYDGHRAKIEASIGYYDSAQLIKNDIKVKDKRKEYLLLGKKLAKDSVAYAFKNGYANLAVLSLTVMNKICEELKLKHSAKQYSKKAEDAQNKYNYQSKIKMIS